MNPTEKTRILSEVRASQAAVEAAEAALEAARVHRAQVAQAAIDSPYFGPVRVAEALGMTRHGLAKTLRLYARSGDTD